MIMKKIYNIIALSLIFGFYVMAEDNGGNSYTGRIDGGNSYQGIIKGYKGAKADDNIAFLLKLKKNVENDIQELRHLQDWLQKNFEEAVAVSQGSKKFDKAWIEQNLEEAVRGVEFINKRFASNDLRLSEINKQLLKQIQITNQTSPIETYI